MQLGVNKETYLLQFPLCFRSIDLFTVCKKYAVYELRFLCVSKEVLVQTYSYKIEFNLKENETVVQYTHKESGRLRKVSTRLNGNLIARDCLKYAKIIGDGRKSRRDDSSRVKS